MRVAFPIGRTNYLRPLGAVIVACQALGHEVFCVQYRNEPELVTRLTGVRADVVIALEPPPPGVVTPWCWLQYQTDFLAYGAPGIRWTREDFARCDAWAIYSDWWRQWLPDGIAERAVVTGMPELDEVEGIDPNAVRREYRLGARPVVLFLPSQDADADLVTLAALRAFDAEAILIIRARPKDRVTWAMRHQADLVITDDAWSPPTILKLLSVASLMVHTYSTAVLEAAYCGVPSVCLVPEHLSFYPGAERVLHGGEGIFCWPDLVYHAPHIRRVALANVTAKPDARATYVERFLGDDGRRGARVRALAAGLVGARRRGSQ